MSKGDIVFLIFGIIAGVIIFVIPILNLLDYRL
jgi:hypothetical protein